jgi:His/Glu/Gln/Arg/opine family amino acid ABC transporter permease subunit
MSTIMDWLSYMKDGLFVSFELIGWCFLFTLILGVLVALCRISTNRALRTLSLIYVEFFRGVPFLALLIFVYFGLGRYVVSLGISDFWLAVAAISVGESAYLAELYRGAIVSVSQGQWNAARSMGLTRVQTIWLVVMPQAIPAAIPPTINQLVSTVKVSSLASLIAVPELTASAQNLIAETFRPMPVYLLLAGIYLVLTVPLSYIAFGIEKLINRRLGINKPFTPIGAVESVSLTVTERV